MNAALARLDRLLPLWPETDAILASALVIQSGAPVYWHNRYSKCARTEWFGPLVERRWSRMTPRVPLLNIGAGSCLATGSDGSEVTDDAECAAFVRRFCEFAAVTTVRDELARRIVHACGGAAELLPCPSIFAARSAGIKSAREGHVALNYMRGAGHYNLGDLPPGEIEAWETAFVKQARRLAAKHPCVMVCHDEREAAEARRLLPEIPVFRGTDWRDCLKVYAGCRLALVNRVHGAMAAASCGKAVVLAGNDTRLLTAAPMRRVRAHALPAREDELAASVAAALDAGDDPGVESFLDAAETAYVNLLRPHLPS